MATSFGEIEQALLLLEILLGPTPLTRGAAETSDNVESLLNSSKMGGNLSKFS